MPLEKDTGSTDLAMLELTTTEGGVIWIVIGSIWAIEKDPDERFTLVKTASESVPVMEAPQEIFDRIQRLMEVMNTDVTEQAYSRYMGEDPDGR